MGALRLTVLGLLLGVTAALAGFRLGACLR